MRLAGLPFLVLATSLTTAAMAPSRAVAGDEVGTVVLGIEPLEGAPDAVAAEITDALRQRVAATKGYQLLQGKDLVEVKLVFACPDAAPACMSTAGKSLGADKVIFGNVKRAGNDYQLTLKMLDVSRAVVESFTAETVTKKHADAAGLRAGIPLSKPRIGAENPVHLARLHRVRHDGGRPARVFHRRELRNVARGTVVLREADVARA